MLRAIDWTAEEQRLLSLCSFGCPAKDPYLLIVAGHDRACCAHRWTRGLWGISEAFLIEWKSCKAKRVRKC